MKTVYITHDGEQFMSLAEATKHEESTAGKEKTLQAAKEALSKVMILLDHKTLDMHQKTDDLKSSIDRYLRSATVSDEYYSSSDNC